MRIRPRPGKDDSPGRCRHWQIYWDLPRVDGQRQQQTETFHGSKTAAETRWRAVQADIDAKGKSYASPSKQRLDGFLQDWLDRRSRDLKPTTMDRYRSLVATHVLPVMGSTALADLTPLAIEDMLAGITEGRRRKAVSGRVAQQARMVLGRALKDAVRLGLLPANPVDRTERPKHTGRKARAFTPDQLDKLFEAAKDSKLLPFLELASYTGMRRGELLGLKWADVDLRAGVLTVRRTIAARYKGESIQPPKTKAGERKVTLPSLAIEALEEQRRRQSDERLVAGDGWKDEGWVFTTRTGGYHNPRNLSRDFTSWRDKAGIPALPFHALRHTNVTMRLAAGVRLETVSKQIGHANLGTTTDVYGHLLPETDKEATEALDAFIRNGTRSDQRGEARKRAPRAASAS